MAKTAPDSAKYVIKAEAEVSGMVERSDVVGAVFGQTEGLLGEELDLRELRETGKVGRMEVDIERQDGKSIAVLKIPSSMNATDTALLAASLETIEKIGPALADVTIDEIQDVRRSKRDYIVKRAKQLLGEIQRDSPSRQQLSEEIKQEIRKEEVVEYRGFDAGPDLEWSDEVILVEGKADVLNLLKHGVKNSLAIGGTSVPDRIDEIAEDREVTAFLDGDRGGDLILQELKQRDLVDRVARAPDDREVEELSKKQVHTALRDSSPVKYTEDTEVEEDTPEEVISVVEQRLEELVGTRAVNALDEELEIVEKTPLSSLEEALAKEPYAVVLDGEITPERVEKAEEAGVKYLAGSKLGETASSSEIQLFTRDSLAESKA
ncbi:MAG: DNA primase DnaG [Candidatus Nanohaloarchaea archaeon]